ncbi:hypothetical protein [Amycolatopsis orientalis]|uniref:hypothetical protein n=1 Tax=Amycolatopsis orientalis TaxID=31958 RepID=UPI00041D7E0B|nr:hypothetical protein [Amycolatopsis orientalis]
MTVDDIDGHPATLSYPGIALIHHHGDHVVGEVWLPVGEEPSFADDEALITALRTALSWSRTAA